MAVQTGLKGFVSHAHAAWTKLDTLSLIVLKKLVMLESVHQATPTLLALRRKAIAEKTVPPHRIQTTRGIESVGLLCYVFLVSAIFVFLTSRNRS